MNSNLSKNILKEEMKKAILSELCKKGVIDFCKYDDIIKKVDEEVSKLKKMHDKDVVNIVINILI